MLNQHPADTSAAVAASLSCNPTGGRRRDPDFYAALDRAASIPDLPEDADRFTAVRLLRRRGLAARLGWTRPLVDHLEYVIQGTTDLDWQPGNLRVNWRTVSRTAFDLGVSEEQVRRNERRLMELGAIAWRDSSNYRRHGRRGRDGRILWAYGVDLSPLALLTDKLQRQATALEAEQEEHRELRGRLSRARRHSRDALLQAIQDGRIRTAAADLLHDELQRLAPHCPAVRIPSDELRRLCEAAERFENELTARLSADSQPETHHDSTNMPAPADPGCLPESITRPNSVQDVVAAAPISPPNPSPPDAARPSAGKEDGSHPGEVGTAKAKAPPHWLILDSLSPRISQYLPATGRTDARDFYDAANLARSGMGISPHAWGEACRIMTRTGAALAVAIIASRLDAEEIDSPGGYLRSLTRAAREGRFNMARSLWGAVDRAERNRQPETDCLAGFEDIDSFLDTSDPHWKHS